MIIGERIRQLRESKKMSQGDIEKRTGLLRCYISRVENGHTVPALETMEKLAAALEIPVYRFFYEGTKPPKVHEAIRHAWAKGTLANGNSKDAVYLGRLRSCLAKMKASDRQTLFVIANRMANR
jgi:transcriptional regulator with XRE-family HTH domain